VLEASEICRRPHAAIVQALNDAVIVQAPSDPGIPDGVLNLITNRPEGAAAVVDAPIADPGTRRMNPQGSRAGGAAPPDLQNLPIDPD
jgi:benzaldehyde dehydrogenase (NAD)